MADQPRKLKLTNARVRDLPTTSETRIYWDLDLSGFGVRKMANSGTATFVLQRRTRKGNSVKVKLGRANEMSAEHARQRALELVREINAGADPAADLKAARIAERERQRAPTVALLIEDWFKANGGGWRPATVDNYRLWADRHVLPELGRRKAHELEPGDVRRWYRGLAATGKGPTANRCLAVLSSAFSWAAASDDWPAISRNPCLLAIERKAKAQEHHRERYPVNCELERLVAVLRDRGDRGDHAARLFLVLLLTGCRIGEARSARWHHFDLDADMPTWTKPRSATKQRRSHRLPLNAEAAAILADLKAEQPFSPFGGLGDTALRKAWVAILEAAEISDLRVHDLRHWHASLLAGMGLSLPVIGAMLGHSSPATTARYTALTDGTLRTAASGLGELVNLAGRRR